MYLSYGGEGIIAYQHNVIPGYNVSKASLNSTPSPIPEPEHTSFDDLRFFDFFFFFLCRKKIYKWSWSYKETIICMHVKL